MPCQNHPLVDEGLVVCWRCRRYFCPNCVAELSSYYFCGDCKTAQVRDLLAGTDMLHLPFSSLGRRFLALFIDGLIKAGVGMVINLIFSVLIVGITARAGRSGSPEYVLGLQGVNFLLQMALQILYEGGMTVWFNGQTLGKMALNMRVVTPDGGTLTAWQGWSRAIVKAGLHGCPCCFVGLADALFALGDERASLHDLFTKTRVVDVN